MSEDRVLPRSAGFGVGNALIALGVLALIAILAFVVISHKRDEALRTSAVTSAASELAAQTPR